MLHGKLYYLGNFNLWYHYLQLQLQLFTYFFVTFSVNQFGQQLFFFKCSQFSFIVIVLSFIVKCTLRLD